MNTPVIRNYVIRLLNNLGWVEMSRPIWGFENFTYEFLSSLSFTKGRSKLDNPNHRVSFQLLNVDYEMSSEHFCNDLGLANAGYIHDSWDHSLNSNDYDPIAFWKSIIGLEQYNSRSNKASNIHNPVFRYLQRVMACTIWVGKKWGRLGPMSCLWCGQCFLVNTSYYLIDYLVSVTKKKSDEKSEIMVGGIITFIARKMGVGEEKGLNKIEAEYRYPHLYVHYKSLWFASKLPI